MNENTGVKYPIGRQPTPAERMQLGAEVLELLEPIKHAASLRAIGLAWVGFVSLIFELMGRTHLDAMLGASAWIFDQSLSEMREKFVRGGVIATGAGDDSITVREVRRALHSVAVLERLSPIELEMLMRVSLSLDGDNN
ncbi:MAG: hypothetical protein ACHQWU_09100 [Gemmatimonadales bacterium]